MQHAVSFYQSILVVVDILNFMMMGSTLACMVLQESEDLISLYTVSQSL